jgi:hypothetical protein
LEFSLEATEVSPGQVVALTGGPLTSVYDTRAQFGGREATVSAVERTDCAPCDACREEAECIGCFPCTECEATCETCIETLTVEVPSLPAGATNAVILNAYGSCAPIPVTILENDTGLADSGIDLVDSADSGLTNCAGFGDLPAPDREILAESSCKNQQNLSTDSKAITETIRYMLARVLDRMRSVMY